MKGQGKELLERRRTASLDQPPQSGAFQVLEQHMWVWAVQHRVESAHDHGMRERREHLGLLAQVLERSLVLRLVGPQDLRDADREQQLVPDQVDLVEVAAAEPAKHGAARRDRIALGELPARALLGRHQHLYI